MATCVTTMFYILSHTHTTHRLGMLPSLARLQSECGVFQSTAIRDLNISIDRLEKARTDYRAALLWMKDVSEKLHNPDYHNQLAKFREVCVSVVHYMYVCVPCGRGAYSMFVYTICPKYGCFSFTKRVCVLSGLSYNPLINNGLTISYCLSS